MADVPGAAGAKPPSRGRTPAKISAASTVSFALGKKLQAAYDAVDVGKTKLIEFAQLTAFLDKAGIKYYDLEIAKIGRQLAFEAEHMERDNGTKLTFDDVLVSASGCAPGFFNNGTAPATCAPPSTPSVSPARA